MPERKIKVLHVLTCFGMGGAETWLLEAAKCLKNDPALNSSMQFDFLLVGGNEKNVLDDAVLETGATIYYTTFSLGNWFAFSKEVKRVLREGQYDVIHSHLDFISGWIFLAAWGSLPHLRISHLHNPILNIKSYIRDGFHRVLSYYGGRILMLLFTDKIVGTSNRVMQEYGYGRFPYKYKNRGALYCGIAVDRFLSYNGQDNKREQLNTLGLDQKVTRLALFVGRIDLDDTISINQKNPGFAFDMAVQLVRQYPTWGFLFVGKKGKLAAELESKLEALNLHGGIKFAGIRNDVHALMAVSDVLVFPALSEGLGLVAVEAQCSALPVLASENVPAEAGVIPELFIQKKLSDGIQSWVNDIAGTDLLKKKSREYYFQKVKDSDFSIENSVKNLYKLYLS